MSKIFKDYYAITSLCRYYFKGNYYHSYTYDKDSNLIFDLCSNAVFIKDEFDDLFETNEILVVKNKDLEEQLSITDFNSIQPESRRKLLRLALFKQSLNLEPDKNLDKKVGAIINLGHETTNVSVYNKGKLMNTETIQLGGLNIDKDLAYMFNINIFDAREIKEKFASSHKRFIALNDVYEVKNTAEEAIKLNQIDLTILYLLGYLKTSQVLCLYLQFF